MSKGRRLMAKPTLKTLITFEYVFEAQDLGSMEICAPHSELHERNRTKVNTIKKTEIVDFLHSYTHKLSAVGLFTTTTGTKSSL